MARKTVQVVDLITFANIALARTQKLHLDSRKGSALW